MNLSSVHIVIAPNSDVNILRIISRPWRIDVGPYLAIKACKRCALTSVQSCTSLFFFNELAATYVAYFYIHICRDTVRFILIYILASSDNLRHNHEVYNMQLYALHFFYPFWAVEEWKTELSKSSNETRLRKVALSMSAPAATKRVHANVYIPGLVQVERSVATGRSRGHIHLHSYLLSIAQNPDSQNSYTVNSRYNFHHIFAVLSDKSVFIANVRKIPSIETVIILFTQPREQVPCVPVSQWFSYEKNAAAHSTSTVADSETPRACSLVGLFYLFKKIITLACFNILIRPIYHKKA